VKAAVAVVAVAAIAKRRDGEAAVGAEFVPEEAAGRRTSRSHATRPPRRSRRSRYPAVRACRPEPVRAEPVRAEPPVQAAVPVAVAAEPVPVEAFVLPTDQLQAVAEAAGLQWVNSDADKIRAVQEAMANEPKPIHVPRQPKPVVMLDEGPLVLVETRKDLTQFKLPFETARESQPQP
jgi:ribonuclease E